MFEEQAGQLEQYSTRLRELRQALNVDAVKSQIAELEAHMGAPGFWDDPETAQKQLQQLKSLRAIVSAPDELQKELEDAQFLIELAQSEDEDSMASDIEDAVTQIGQRLQRLEINSLFSDPRDNNDAIVSIHPGAGGTESCDWAEMLYGMVMRWCERQNYSVDLLDYQPGDEAGLKSATLNVSGPFAFGHLKSEAGVHRLVRISPYDSAKRRHTSFAAIEVLTPVNKDIEIEVKDEDLKVDVFRASGPGGQKVNKTSSAVRLTHAPSGIVVACQSERSQHRNRDVAIDLLKAKLYDIEIKKQEADLEAQREGQQDVAWGSQIRSYVLHPYQMVKDHRTEAETGNVDRVLENGEIDMFVEAYLKWQLERKGAK